MNKFVYFVVAIIAIAVIGFAFGSKKSSQQTTSSKPQQLTKAPVFSLQDYAGKTVNSADFFGKPLVVNAWASWCPFCVEELPDFATVQQEFGDQVVIIGVNRAEKRDVAKQFSDAYQVTEKLILLLDLDDSFYQSIGGFTMPETIFVNRKGEIVEHIRGPMAQDVIREKIKRLLET